MGFTRYSIAKVREDGAAPGTLIPLPRTCWPTEAAAEEPGEREGRWQSRVGYRQWDARNRRSIRLRQWIMQYHIVYCSASPRPPLERDGIQVVRRGHLRARDDLSLAESLNTVPVNSVQYRIVHINVFIYDIPVQHNPRYKLYNCCSIQNLSLHLSGNYTRHRSTVPYR